MVVASHLVVAVCRITGHLSIRLEIHDKMKISVSCVIKQCSLLKVNDVLEEHFDNFFMVEE
jgi:hypothetical protein